MFIFDHIIFYRIGEFLARHLPINLSYLIAIIISDLHYLFAKQDRREVSENLAVIFPEKNKKEIAKIRLKLFRNFAKYLVDFFRFSKLDEKYIKDKVTIEDIENLKEALCKGKGVIGLTIHLGNWELGGVLIAMLGYPIWAVALPHRDKRVDRFFNLQREKKGLKVISIEEATKKCINILKEKKILALLGDRDFTQNGIRIDFFNKPTLLPLGPAIFSLRMEAPIVPAFMIRKHKDYFLLKFEKPIYPVRKNNLEESIKDLILQYKGIFEKYIQKYPEQWYMFRRFWIEE